MDEAFRKFVKKLLMEKYPMYSDVYAYQTPNIMGNNCYDVYLLISGEERNKMKPRQITEVNDFVRTIAKFMNQKVCGIYNKIVNEEEWEQIKSNSKK